MTDGVRKAMQDLTGHYVGTCPWHAMQDPLVSRVLAVMPFFESGQLEYIAPQPSHRLVAGVRFYNNVYNSMFSKQQELDRQNRDRATAIAQPTTIRRGR